MDCVPNREYVESWTQHILHSVQDLHLTGCDKHCSFVNKKKMFPLVDQGPLLIQVCVKYVHKTYDLSCLNYASFLYF